ncbi:MAG: translocation/assembly module TamB domain-containing protein [Neisseria sp.]|nr:translocation/assembly module TamB domain-containing protein [Neisseria sp.]
MNQTSSPDTPAPAAAPKKRRRWWRRLLGSIVLLVLLLMLAVWWLASTSAGLHTAFFRLPALFGVNISAESTEGTLWQGFKARNIRIQTNTADITLKSLVLDWDASQLRKSNLLHVRLLELGEMTIVATGSSADRASSPPKMPRDVDLPFHVQIDRAVSHGILWGKNKDVILSGADLNYSYLNHLHRLSIVALTTPWGQAQGGAALHNTAPFPAAGKVILQGFINQAPAHGEITLSGSLQDLLLKAELRSANMVLDVDSQVSPFAADAVSRIHHVTLNLGNVNPQDFWQSAPQANITLFADLMPDEQATMLEGIMMLSNARALPANRSGIPLVQSHAFFTVNPHGVVTIEPLEAELLRNGKITLSGSISEQLDLSIDVAAVTVADFIGGAPQLPMNGVVRVKGTGDNPDITWQLQRGDLTADGLVTLRTVGKQREQTLTIEKALFNDGKGGSANLSGSLKQFGDQALDMTFRSERFNPAVFGSDYPQGNVNGRVSVKGTVGDAMQFLTRIDFTDSTLSGMPLVAQGVVDYRDAHVAPSKLNIGLGPNRIIADGTFGKKNDKLNLNIRAPQLERFGFGLNGALEAQGFVAGDLRSLDMRLRGRADAFAFRDLIKLRQLDFDLTASPDIHAPLDIKLTGSDLSVTGNAVEHVTLNAKGTLARHALTANAALTAESKPYRADIAAQGGMNENHQWTGTVERFNLGGTLNVLLENPVRLSVSEQALNLGAARWRVLGGNLNLQALSWQKKAGFATRGQANGIHLAQLETITTLPIQQDLVLAADWDVQYNENARGTLTIRREAGDVILPGRSRSLGLDKLTLETRLAAGRIHNTLDGLTRFGDVTAQLDIAQNFGDDILNAPISGSLKVNADDLARFKYFLPVGMDLGGDLLADIDIRGTLSDPLLSGELNAQKLVYNDLNNGIRLDNGVLKSHFDGKKWLIESLLFTHADGGTLEVTGDVSRVGLLPSVNLQLVFTEYPVLNHPDREVMLSGQSQIHYADQTGLALTGELVLDNALFDFPKSGMPAVSDDVVIIGAPPKEPAGSMPLALNLTLDLNDSFGFSGKGLNVLMGGKLTLTAKPKENINLLGMVNVVYGRYNAYGQDLEVERGQITFLGPIDNPALNLRAKRRMSPVGAGVEVTGTLNHPRATLVADSPMSDKDKLAWLVLGRAAAGEGDDAALAAAAGTWLAGGINDKIGLVDDIGMTSRASRNPATGEMNPAEQMITVGKHLTDRIYLGYEYGLSSAAQAAKLVYQLSKSVQLIGRVGTEEAGGEIRYSKRFD